MKTQRPQKNNLGPQEDLSLQEVSERYGKVENRLLGRGWEVMIELKAVKRGTGHRKPRYALIYRGWAKDWGC